MTKQRDRVALLVGLLLVIAPLLLIRVFPSQDGPSHIDTAGIGRLLAENAPTVSAVYEAVPFGLSNSIAPMLLGQFIRVLDGVHAEWALNLLITVLIVIPICLAPWLFRRRMAWALVGLPLAAPFMLYMGSISLGLSYGLAFLALLCMALHLARPNRVALPLFVLFALATFVVQAQAAIAIVLAVFGGVGGAGLWRTVSARVHERGYGRLATALVATVPAIVCVVLYRLSFPDNVVSSGVSWNVLRSFYEIGLRKEVAQFSVLDTALLAAGLIVLGLAALLWVARTFRAPASSSLASEWLFFAAFAIFAVAVVLPHDTRAIPQIPQRLLPAAHFLIFLWLLSVELPRKTTRTIIALAAVTLLSLGISRTIAHWRLAQSVTDAAEVEAAIPDGSVVAHFNAGLVDRTNRPLSAGGLTLEFDPLVHGGRGIGLRDVVTLDNYQAEASFPYFAIRYRPELMSYKWAVQPDVVARYAKTPDDLRTWIGEIEQRTRMRVSHVTVNVTGLSNDPIAPDSGLKVLQDFLRADFSLEPGAPYGTTELWKRR